MGKRSSKNFCSVLFTQYGHQDGLEGLVTLLSAVSNSWLHLSHLNQNFFEDPLNTSLGVTSFFSIQNADLGWDANDFS